MSVTNADSYPPIVTALTAKLLDPLHLSPPLHAFFSSVEVDVGPARPTQHARVTKSILGERHIDPGPPEDVVLPYPGKDPYEGPNLLR